MKLLDREAPRGEGSIRVYYLQHANAEELTKVLTTLPSKQTAETEKGKTPVISKEARIVADKATNSLIIMAEKDDYLVLEEVIQKLEYSQVDGLYRGPHHGGECREGLQPRRGMGGDQDIFVRWKKCRGVRRIERRRLQNTASALAGKLPRRVFIGG